MGTISNEGRQRVIEAAAIMLASSGLRAISIREVVKFSGTPLGSAYHNFPGGKQQIITEAIIWAGAQASAQLSACLEKDRNNGINLFLSLWRQRLVGSQYRHGCPIVAAAIELPEEDEASEIKAAVARVFSDWQSLLAQHFESLGHTKTSANAMALSIIACIEGAVVMCRGYQSIEPFDAILECIPKLVEKTL